VPSIAYCLAIAAAFLSLSERTCLAQQEFGAAPGFAQTHDDAKAYVVNETVNAASFIAPGPRFWTFPYFRSRTRYIQFHFDQIHADSEQFFELRIVDLPSEEVIVRYDGARFAKEESFITDLLPAGDLRVELHAPAAPAGLSFRLERVLWHAEPDVAVVHSPVFDFKPVLTLAPDDPARVVAQSVALLHIGPSETTCTGVLIDRETLVSNYHCILYSLSFQRTESADHPSCSDILVEFDYLRKDERGIMGRCFSLRVNKALDVALLTIDPDKIRGKDGSFRSPVSLRSGEDSVPTTVSLMQHPLGLPLSICRCIVSSYDKDDMLHDCLSANGSSGSPLLDEKMDWLGLHYQGAYPDNFTLRQMENHRLLNGVRLNRAKRSSLISEFRGKPIRGKQTSE
jgi:hypothetical protein